MRHLRLALVVLLLLPGLWKIGAMDAAAQGKEPASAVQPGLTQPAANSASHPSSTSLANAQQAGAMPASDAAASNGLAGSEACATCHADVATKFATNPHSKLALMHGGSGATCESCHGPGQAHVESGGDATKLFRFEKATAKQVDEKCLSCHVGSHPNFELSAHAKAGVSCTSCHSVHSFQSGAESREDLLGTPSGKGEASLLKASQPTLCYGCHSDVQPSFAQPFHHKVDEGLMQCSDCHDPHGAFQGKQLKSTADQNAICTKCHAETAGPFTFEHPVVKVEGCSSCHSPHGSPNPRMLNVSNVNTLCLQCHSGTNMFAFPNAVSETGGPVHNQSTQYTPCTNCHSQIHGSNAATNFFR